MPIGGIYPLSCRLLCRDGSKNNLQSSGSNDYKGSFSHDTIIQQLLYLLPFSSHMIIADSLSNVKFYHLCNVNPFVQFNSRFSFKFKKRFLNEICEARHDIRFQISDFCFYQTFFKNRVQYGINITINRGHGAGKAPLTLDNLVHLCTHHALKSRKYWIYIEKIE